MRITFKTASDNLLRVTGFGVLVGVGGTVLGSGIAATIGSIACAVGLGGLAVTGIVYLGNEIYSIHRSNKIIKKINYDESLDAMLMAYTNVNDLNFAATIQKVTVNSASITLADSTFIGGEAVNSTLQAITTATASSWSTVASLLPQFSQQQAASLDDAYALLDENALRLPIAPDLPNETMQELRLLPAGNTDPSAHDLACESGAESAEDNTNDQSRKLLSPMV